MKSEASTTACNAQLFIKVGQYHHVANNCVGERKERGCCMT